MKNILIISALFPPEPVVSAKLSEDIANFLSKINNVTVIAPLPTRPFGFDLTKPNKIKKLYDLISLDSYTCPESNLYGRLRESYSFGIACKKYIKKNHNQIVSFEPIQEWDPYLENMYKNNIGHFDFQLKVYLDRAFIQSKSNSILYQI